MLLSKIDFSDGTSPPVWNAYAACRSDGATALESEIEAFLDDANLCSQMTDLLSALEAALMHPRGPQLFLGNSKLCHEAVAGTGIYELIKKNLRLYWFYGEGSKVIILSAVHHKKTKKTPPVVVKRLRSILNDYREACRNKTLRVIDR